MLFLKHSILIILDIAAIIYSCYLFSNAIEHLGIKLKLGNNATGSILAVIGTSLPETVVPLVAIFGSMFFKTSLSTGQNIASGAIIGSPFILSTLAMFLIGIVLLNKKREKKELIVDYENIKRDYKYFLSAYSLAILATFINSKIIKICLVMVLLFLYCFFVYRTIIKSKQTFEEHDTDVLFFSKIICFKKCANIYVIIAQIILSLFALIIFSHFFVNEIKFASYIFKINPVILSLMLAPVATELPEIVNSIIWLKQDKDDLAVANVAGAIVFQAMVPCSIGILFTTWKFDNIALLNMILTLICGIIFTLFCFVNKKIKLFPLLLYGIFYFGFLAYLILN